MSVSKEGSVACRLLNYNCENKCQVRGSFLYAGLGGVSHLLENLLQQHFVASLGANTSRALQAA
jgi:hypothetical protein